MIKFYSKNTFLINFLFKRQASLPLLNYTALALNMDVWEKPLPRKLFFRSHDSS